MDQYETNQLEKIRTMIKEDPMNIFYVDQGYELLYWISVYSIILIVGQAPGIKA